MHANCHVHLQSSACCILLPCQWFLAVHRLDTFPRYLIRILRGGHPHGVPLFICLAQRVFCRTVVFSAAVACYGAASVCLGRHLPAYAWCCRHGFGSFLGFSCTAWHQAMSESERSTGAAPAPHTSVRCMHIKQVRLQRQWLVHRRCLRRIVGSLLRSMVWYEWRYAA